MDPTKTCAEAKEVIILRFIYVNLIQNNYKSKYKRILKEIEALITSISEITVVYLKTDSIQVYRANTLVVIIVIAS